MSSRALWVIAALLAAILVVEINPPGPWLDCERQLIGGAECHRTWVPTDRWIGVRF